VRSACEKKVGKWEIFFLLLTFVRDYLTLVHQQKSVVSGEAKLVGGVQRTKGICSSAKVSSLGQMYQKKSKQMGVICCCLNNDNNNFH
jgi:hypothetical protein